MNAVACQGASLEMAGRPVLAGLDFVIAEKSFVGMLGPNGAGKTTLMRAILGLVPPSAGEIRVLGAPPAWGNAAIGYLPQSRAGRAGWHLSGWDFVASAACGVGWGVPWLSATQRAEVERVLELVEATAFARRPIGALSGGQRQKLLLAQALLGAPRLLLLDEPLLSLDPRQQAAVVALVRGVQRALGIAVLFSAHDINPLLPAMDQVLYLGGGQAVLGSVADVVTGPVLSLLYGAPMEVVRLGARYLVVAGETVAG